MLEKDVVEISGKNINIDEFELLDDITEFSAKDAELSEFSVLEDCDKFFRQHELADDFENGLISEMGEFYGHLQYSIDDVPLASHLQPVRKLTGQEMFTRHSVETLDTDLPYGEIL